MLVALFYYFSWDVSANLAEETADANMASGIACILGVLVTAGLFVLAQVAVQMALTQSEIQANGGKSAESQAALMLHKTRGLLIKQRTMSVNALRGHLAEFGLVAAKGIGRVDELIAKAETGATLPDIAKAALKVLAEHLETIEAKIAELDAKIASAHAQNPIRRLLAGIPGIGKIAASAIAASASDPSVFKSGRDFAAWLGATPRQNSSGGKEKLGSITKQGNRYIRRLLVLGATSLARVWHTSGKASYEIGWSRFSRTSPRDWSPSLWPTSSHGSYGPL